MSFKEKTVIELYVLRWTIPRQHCVNSILLSDLRSEQKHSTCLLIVFKEVIQLLLGKGCLITYFIK